MPAEPFADQPGGIDRSEARHQGIERAGIERGGEPERCEHAIEEGHHAGGNRRVAGERTERRQHQTVAQHDERREQHRRQREAYQSQLFRLEPVGNRRADRKRRRHQHPRHQHLPMHPGQADPARRFRTARPHHRAPMPPAGAPLGASDARGQTIGVDHREAGVA